MWYGFQFYPQDSRHENWKDICFFQNLLFNKIISLSVVGKKAIYNKRSITSRLKHYNELGEFCILTAKLIILTQIIACHYSDGRLAFSNKVDWSFQMSTLWQFGWFFQFCPSVYIMCSETLLLIYFRATHQFSSSLSQPQASHTPQPIAILCKDPLPRS